jgi:MYXO-CTERM domain-containing protein
VVEGDHSDPARGWPDTLATAALAGFDGDPILLTNRDRLPDETIGALGRLGVDRVTITGGTAAVSQAVEDRIRTGDIATDRLAGDTRFETALAVRDAQITAGMDATTLTLASGLDWPDALAAGPVSAIAGTTFAIIDGQGGPDTLDQLLAVEGLRTVRLVGDESAISVEVEQRIVEAISPQEPAEDEPQTAGISTTSPGDAVLLVGMLLLLAAGTLRRRRV